MVRARKNSSKWSEKTESTHPARKVFLGLVGISKNSSHLKFQGLKHLRSKVRTDQKLSIFFVFWSFLGVENETIFLKPREVRARARLWLNQSFTEGFSIGKKSFGKAFVFAEKTPFDQQPTSKKNT